MNDRIVAKIDNIDGKSIKDNQSKFDRHAYAKSAKDLSKDIFDMIRNALIVAGVQAVYTVSDNWLIKYIYWFLFLVFCVHLASLIAERTTLFPFIWKRGVKVVTAVSIIITLITLGGAMGLINLSEDYLINKVIKPEGLDFPPSQGRFNLSVDQLRRLCSETGRTSP